MRYLIKSIIQHGSSVKEFCFAPVEGGDVPIWKPGAHVVLSFKSRTGVEFKNAYSLLGSPSELLRIAVQREDHGHGGSKTLHDEFTQGMEIDLSSPNDSFQLSASSSRNLLIAGGIGITPLISMARALYNDAKPFELHYLARDISRLILMSELDDLYHENIFTYLTSNSRPNLETIIEPYKAGDELYACGPLLLLNDVRSTAIRLGWPDTHIHFESFGQHISHDDNPVNVHLRQSGITLEVIPGTSILDAMIAVDAFVSYDCKRGECGYCYVNVLSGEPVHRDVCLTEKQRAKGMTTCVSWSATTNLELDL